MTTTHDTSPMHALAEAVGGVCTDTNAGPSIVTDHGLIYVGMPKPGKPAPVRLERPGHAVVTLGGWRDEPEALAAAFREVVSS